MKQFLSDRPAPGETRPLTQTEGADDGRVGRVFVIDATNTNHGDSGRVWIKSEGLQR